MLNPEFRYLKLKENTEKKVFEVKSEIHNLNSIIIL